VSTFALHILTKMTKPFSFITIDGNASVPSDIIGADLILASPLCEAWYTQNYDGTLTHQKLRPVPIGFDLYTPWPGLRTKSVNGQKDMGDTKTTLENMLAQRRAIFGSRTRDILVPPWSLSHNERSRANAAIECLKHVHLERREAPAMWSAFLNFSFALSPRGNGLDAHRTWELLFFGVVPICKTSAIDPLYVGLPVILVQDWTAVCIQGFFDREWKKRAPVWPAPLEAFTNGH
jgi:hypothetical protein